MGDTLPRDIWHHEIFPLLDNISFLCLQIAFCRRKLPTLLSGELEEEVAKYDVGFVKYFKKRKLLVCDSIASNAAIHGNVMLLEHILLKRYPIYYKTTVENAATGGHLEFLQVLCREGRIQDYIDMHNTAIYSAVQAGQIPCLKFLLEKKNSVCWEEVIQRCVIEDRVEAIIFVLEYFKIDLNMAHVVNVVRSYTMCETAARCGALQCLKYYHKRLGELPTSLHIIAITHNKLHILQYLIDKGHVLNEEPYWRDEALRSPTIRKYLIQLGYRFCDDICDCAVGIRNVDALQDLFEVGYKFTDRTTLIAMSRYDLACLKFVCGHGGHIHKDCSYKAALVNKVEALQYLHEQGAIITDIVVFHSAAMKHLECLKYALEHKFPVNIQELRRISDKLDDDTRMILRAHNIDI